MKQWFSRVSHMKLELQRKKLASLNSFLVKLITQWFTTILTDSRLWQSALFFDYLGFTDNNSAAEQSSSFQLDSNSVRLERSHSRGDNNGDGWKLQDFQLVKVLGKGCMGKVLLVRENASGHFFAMKSIHKKTIVNQREIEHSLSERHILTQLSLAKHPFLVHLYGCFQSPSELFYIFQYYPGGDLATQLAIFRNFSLDRVKFYAVEIILALEALHSFGVIYRDLKPENILLAEDGHIALTDFGLSKQLVDNVMAAANPVYEQSSDDCGQLSYCQKISGDLGLTRTFCGTAEYLAPEILLGLPYSIAVDWWSFGTLIYEMAVGITPFWCENPLEMYHKVVNHPLTFPTTMRESSDPQVNLFCDFLTKLLVRQPSQRLSLSAIKGHPWLLDAPWESFLTRSIEAPYHPDIKNPAHFLEEATEYFDEEFTKLPAQLTPMESLTASMQLPFRGFSYQPKNIT